VASVTTGQPVNLYQLAQELGVPVAWRMVGPRPDGTRTISTDDVAQSVLDTAIAAHVADPTVVPDEPPAPPDPPTVDERLAAVAAAVAAAAQVETIADMEAFRQDLAAALGGQ